MPTATVPVSQRVRRNFGPPAALDLTTQLKTAGWRLWEHGDANDPNAAAIARTGTLRFYSTRAFPEGHQHAGKVGYELWFRPKIKPAPKPPTPTTPTTPTPVAPTTPGAQPEVIAPLPPPPPPAVTTTPLQLALAAESALPYRAPQFPGGASQVSDQFFSPTIHFGRLPNASPWRWLVPQYRAAIPFAEHITATAQALGFKDTRLGGDILSTRPTQQGNTIVWSIPSRIQPNVGDGTNFLFTLQRWERPA